MRGQRRGKQTEDGTQISHSSSHKSLRAPSQWGRAGLGKKVPLHGLLAAPLIGVQGGAQNVISAVDHMIGTVADERIRGADQLDIFARVVDAGEKMALTSECNTRLRSRHLEGGGFLLDVI